MENSSMDQSFIKRLFLKRPINPKSPNSDGQDLKKTLGLLDLIMMGLGTTIGSGIFVISGIASSIAGLGIFVSFLIASLCCLCVALCYAELSAMIPLTGSAYTYAYTIFGEIFAWLIGWAIMLELTICISVVGSGWSQYVSGFLSDIGVSLPFAFTQDPGGGGMIDLLAISIIFLMSFILLQGAKESSRVNIVLVFIKLAVLSIFFWFGFQAIHLEHYNPVFPTGLQGILSGAGLIIISYIGFEFIATSAEEVKNPQKTLPIGLIATILICTILYILTGFVLTGILPYTSYEHVAAPIIFALNHTGLTEPGGFIAFAILIGITSGLLVTLYGASRMIFALSRDGLLPPSLATLNKKGIPARATVLISIVGALLAGFTPIEMLAELLNMGTLVAFISVAAGVLVMRWKNPDIHRPFYCPLFPFVPVIAIITCIILIAFLKPVTLIWFCLWVCAGCVVYSVYGMKGSKIGLEYEKSESLL